MRTSSPVAREFEQFALTNKSSWQEEAENALIFYRESFMTREDHARDNVEWMLRNFGRPGRKRRLSPGQQKRLQRRVDDEVRNLRAKKALGNLFLPVELYCFVRRKIAGGTFSSPTEVLEAAMPFLRAQQGAPKRAEIVL